MTWKVVFYLVAIPGKSCNPLCLLLLQLFHTYSNLEHHGYFARSICCRSNYSSTYLHCLGHRLPSLLGRTVMLNVFVEAVMTSWKIISDPCCIVSHDMIFAASRLGQAALIYNLFLNALWIPLRKTQTARPPSTLVCFQLGPLTYKA